MGIDFYNRYIYECARVWLPRLQERLYYLEVLLSRGRLGINARFFLSALFDLIDGILKGERLSQQEQLLLFFSSMGITMHRTVLYVLVLAVH